MQGFRWGALWFWSSTAGLALPFLVADIAKAAASRCRADFKGVGVWVAGSALGWTMAGAMAAIADRLPQWLAVRGIGGALLFLGAVAIGGLLLGAVTGVTLCRLSPVWDNRHEE